MTHLAPYTVFGKTKNVPVVLRKNNQIVHPFVQWDETLWVERQEDLYVLMAPNYKDKIVRIIERELWLQSEEI